MSDPEIERLRAERDHFRQEAERLRDDGHKAARHLLNDVSDPESVGLYLVGFEVKPLDGAA